MDVLGAFLTDYKTGKILYGTGGSVTRVRSSSAVKNAFYLKDFFSDEFLCYQPERWTTLTRGELFAQLGDVKEVKARTLRNYDHTYARDFEKLKTCFSEGLKKVVLVSREEILISERENAKKAFFKKALTFNTGMPYGLWTEEYGVVGSTPELLFHLNENHLETFALAGTARLEKAQELQRSEKDLFEHQLVIRDLKEKLETHAQGIEVYPTTIQPFKSIVHLRTNMTAKVNEGTSLLKLAATLSPTAALGGYPKEAGLAFLRACEYGKLDERRYFGSTFGVISPEMNQFVVSIRNIQWKRDLVFIDSGTGIVPESDLQRELEEVGLKRETVRNHYL